MLKRSNTHTQHPYKFQVTEPKLRKKEKYFLINPKHTYGNVGRYRTDYRCIFLGNADFNIIKCEVPTKEIKYYFLGSPCRIHFFIFLFLDFEKLTFTL